MLFIFFGFIIKIGIGGKTPSNLRLCGGVLGPLVHLQMWVYCIFACAKLFLLVLLLPLHFFILYLDSGPCFLCVDLYWYISKELWTSPWWLLLWSQWWFSCNPGNLIFQILRYSSASWRIWRYIPFLYRMILFCLTTMFKSVLMILLLRLYHRLAILPRWFHTCPLFLFLFWVLCLDN